MCGISGFSGRFSRELLEAMNASIAYRGPDDSDILLLGGKHGRIGLAHRRLSIIDLSREGRQPMGVGCDCCGVSASSSPGGRLWLVCNGEIYNYRELRSELIGKGHRFHSQSDSEVLLHLYAEEGVEMLTKLNGIFAFALYDGRLTGQFNGVEPGDLLLARDGLGVKPLYYAVNKSGFLFASELKALLQESSIDRSLDFEAIQSYLIYQWCPAPRTPIKSVKKLEPGHALIIRNGNIRRHWQYYDLPYDQPIESLSKGEAVREVQGYVRKAVRRQMVADVPVGAFLSGGLDSSAVVAFAREVASEKILQCFTIGFSRKDVSGLDGMTEDLPYARRVAEHLGVDLHVVQAGPDMIDDVERMIYHLDEPQGDPAPINVLLISNLARKRGIKVLLSGAGGDDIFSGYRRHFAFLQERYWDWLPQVLRKRIGGAAQHIHVDNPVGRRFSKAFQYAGLNGDRRIASYFFWINPEQLLPLYGPMMREQIAFNDPSGPLTKTLSHLSEETHPLNKMLYLEGKHFLADHNLNYTDKISMAAGVEVRVPLLDPDLVALAARLPVEYKQRGKVGKWVFKKAMEPYLPKEVVYRPKTGFGAPLRYWLRNQLRPMVEDVLSEGSLKSRGLFDPAGVRNLVKMDRMGRIDGSYTVFSLMCIELWCRIFLDGNRAWMKTD